MFKFVKIAVVAGVLATLTACTGHIENKKILQLRLFAAPCNFYF
ncbi:outer membrane lipoprotein, partial [Salmonella enterica subsp. enterica serovar Enteritidis str. SARB17]